MAYNGNYSNGFRHGSTATNQNHGGDPRGSMGPIPIIVIIGKTGSGKSSFIDTLGGKDLQGNPPTVDGGLNSCTSVPTAYIVEIQNRRVYLLDTPGFDDSAKDNITILNDIASNLYVTALRNTELEIRGVIFMHDISETRLAGSQRKTWEILTALVGEECMGNIIVGTTMWSTGLPRKLEKEEKRERDLISTHWRGIHKTMRVAYEDEACARRIIAEVLSRPPVLLQIQKEMMTPPHTVENTTAGKIAIPEGKAEAKRLEKEIEELRKAREEDERKWREEMRKMEEERVRREAEQKRQAEEELREREEEFRRQQEERQRQFEEECARRDEEHRRVLEEQLRRQEEAHKRREEENRRQQEERHRKFKEEYAKRDEERKREFQEQFQRQEEAHRRREEENRRQQEERQRRSDEERAKRDAENRREWKEMFQRQEDERRRQQEANLRREENRLRKEAEERKRQYEERQREKRERYQREQEENRRRAEQAREDKVAMERAMETAARPKGLFAKVGDAIDEGIGLVKEGLGAIKGWFGF